MNQFIKTVSAEGLLGIFNESQKKIYTKIDNYFNQVYNYKLPSNVEFFNDKYTEFVNSAFNDIEKIGQSNYLKTLIIDFVNYYVYEPVNITKVGATNVKNYQINEDTLIQIDELKQIIQLHQNLTKLLIKL